MPPIYRKFIRETAGHPAAYIPSVVSRNLVDGISVPDYIAAAIQIYPRIKVKLLDDYLAALDAQTKSITPLSQVLFPVLFPRMNSGSQGYTAAWVANNYMFNMDGVLLGGVFENVPSTRPAVINALQAGNGYGVTCRAVQYVIGDHATTNNGYSMSSGNAPTWYNELINNNWLLYANGTSGTTEPNFFNTSFIQVNNSDYPNVPLNSRGHKVEDELAYQALRNFITGGFAGCSANLNCFFHDTMAAYCAGGNNKPANGDWDRDGTTDVTKSDAVALQWRKGLKRFFDYMRANRPGIKLVGNLDATCLSENGTPYFQQAKSVITPWDSNFFDGVMHESVLGATWSIGTWSTFANAMRSIQYYEDLCSDPTLCMFGNNYLAANGTDTQITTSYQASRFTMAACYVFSNMGLSWTNSARKSGDGISTAVDWYDEFSVHPTTGVCRTAWSNAAQYRKWMGTARDARVPYNASAWQNGVYRRIFNGQGGKAVHWMINPTSSAVTVTMDTNLRRLTGTQAPSVNNGAAQNIGSTYTFQAKDAIAMLEQ